MLRIFFNNPLIVKIIITLLIILLLTQYFCQESNPQNMSSDQYFFTAKNWRSYVCELNKHIGDSTNNFQRKITLTDNNLLLSRMGLLLQERVCSHRDEKGGNYFHVKVISFECVSIPLKVLALTCATHFTEIKA